MAADNFDELLRVLTNDGELTDEYLPREYVHQNGIYHQEVAFIAISTDGCVLLQRRSKNKQQYPSCWALCAGHVVGSETTLEAAVNEANEELFAGRPILTSKDLSILQNKIRNDRENNKCFATCYFKIMPKETEFHRQEEEVDELKWVPFPEFCAMVEREDKAESIFKNNEYYQAIIKQLALIFQEWPTIKQKQ